MEKKEISEKEVKIRKIARLYYSRQDIQKAIFEFSKNREVVPSYMMEGFGRRPDSLQYPGDVFEMVNKGATSFHCSEELWEDPLKLSTELSGKELDELRTGWDLLIDVDSKYLDYSKIMAELIIKTLEFHGVKNIGIKFSGNKGFHIIVPNKAFPQEINNIKTKEMFPQWPRIVLLYLTESVKPQLIDKITELTYDSKYIKDFEATEKVIPDVILVSPRHLFRAPYSLHEKTALASIVLDKNKIREFEPSSANPLKIKPKDFIPEAEKNEAKELLTQALDWYKENKEERVQEDRKFEPIVLKNVSDINFPPCIKKILNGLTDGRKRALFILINFFRSISFERAELEKRVDEWNKKNEKPLKQGYIKIQLAWSYRNKSLLPPNCDKDHYKGIGVCNPDNFCRLVKNPVNYTIKKTITKQDKGKNVRKN